MPTLKRIPCPKGLVSGSVGAGLSSGEIVLGNGELFAIRCSAAANIKFGNSGMAAAAATDYIIPANNSVPDEFDMGDANDRIRIFSTPGCTYTILTYARS